MAVSNDSTIIRGDRPIDGCAEDRLGRAPFAQAVAAQILESPAIESFVVAVMGPWGSGKTSLLNMVTEEVTAKEPETIVVRFNPWLFSGSEQLVGFFFRELGAQISELETDRTSKFGESLEQYAGLVESVAGWIPGWGSVIEKGAKAAQKVGATMSRPPSIHVQRTKIRETLAGLDRRIVVLVDDIDRLQRDEICEVMKLVRLTGDFPSIVYVLAFDRRRVEAALGGDDETGRAFLEKIVQVAYDVPMPLDEDISRLLLEAIEKPTNGIDHGTFDEKEWPNVFHTVIRPLLRSPRDISRYVNALPPTLRVIGKEVALVDVLALEAVRTFLPDLFRQLPSLVEILTTADQGSRNRIAEEASAKKITNLIDDAGNNGDVVRALFSRVFPHAERFLNRHHYSDSCEVDWAKARRVATMPPLQYYLNRRLPEGTVRTAMVEAAIALLINRADLHQFLLGFNERNLEDLIERLCLFELEFPLEGVIPALGAVLDVYDRLREGRTHMFDVGARMTMFRLVLRLLRRIPKETLHTGISDLLPTLKFISAARQLVRIAAQHGLASTTQVEEWEAAVLDRLASASSQQLWQERDLAALVGEILEAGGERATRMRTALADDRAMIRLLASALQESRRMPLGDVASVRELSLPWDDLVRYFGPDLAARIAPMQAKAKALSLSPRMEDALQVASKYASGWRPSDPFSPKPNASEDSEKAV